MTVYLQMLVFLVSKSTILQKPACLSFLLITCRLQTPKMALEERTWQRKSVQLGTQDTEALHKVLSSHWL